MRTYQKLWIILASMFIGIASLNAQNKITLSHLGTPAFFTNLTTAITAAANGDTLYLPGGTIAPTGTDITVNKIVHIIGAGHYPDSTAATGRTLITTLRYLTGSGGGSIQGCAVSNFYVGYSTNQNISGLIITRCRFDYFRVGYDASSTLDNIMVTDNVFTGDFYVHNAYSNLVIQRNIFNCCNTLNGQSLTFRNNIIYQYYLNSFSGFSSCVFENNIIICTTSSNMSLACSNCNFSKNLFIGNIGSWGTNLQQNSLLSQTAANTFENSPGTAFSYSYNYRLKSTSPGKNYGTDGTDVGIYGTSTPYKDGAVPSNPHIISSIISGQTSPQGILNVNISVSAQDR